jgi:hypothetical protein
MQESKLATVRRDGVPPVPPASELVGQFERPKTFGIDETRAAEWAAADAEMAESRQKEYGKLSDDDFSAAAARLARPRTHLGHEYFSHRRWLERCPQSGAVTVKERCVICGKWKEALPSNFQQSHDTINAPGEERFKNSVTQPCRECMETCHYQRARHAVNGLTHESFDEFADFPVPANAEFFLPNVRFLIALIMAQGGWIVWFAAEHARDREVLFHQTLTAMCAVWKANLMTLDSHKLGISVDNAAPTGGWKRCDHKVDFSRGVLRFGNPPQHRLEDYGFILDTAVAATVKQALSEIEAYDASPNEYARCTAANTERLLADTDFIQRVEARVRNHKKKDRENGRANDVTTESYLSYLEKKGARCSISGILFGEREWECSMDRLDDRRGHIIAEPRPCNVQFILRMLNTQIKCDRTLFLQVLLMQEVQELTGRQRRLIHAELERLTGTAESP